MKVRDEILMKLETALQPLYLEVENESHGHNVPPNSETHFKVVCASTAFEGLTRVKRHQSVYGLLSDQLDAGVHALALHLYTPSEWQVRADAPASPDCMGGGG